MKKHTKWFQDATNINIADNSSTFTVFKNLYTPQKISTNHSQSPEQIPQQSLQHSLLLELYQFKEQHLYEEALACIQTLFEMNAVNEDIIYELADIYLLSHDYERALKWTQQLKNKAPEDNRIYLLEMQIFLELNHKDEILTSLNQLLAKENLLLSEEYYLILDNIINRLKKIFKTDKLLRRCPKLNDYWKKRRQSLKNKKNSTTLSVNVLHTDDITKGDTMPQINVSLQDALNRIWDLQNATTKDQSIILTTSTTELSQAIMQQVLAYSKKLWLFNYIAEIFHREKKFSATIYLLQQALLLDDENDLILKNLGYVFYQQHDYHNALITLNDIKIKDFIVNDLIDKCHNQINN